ncbi:MAG TPA: carboxypeptidase-like regulatory domain-containing protein [Pyrinomonadaceae bacterium]
MTRDRRACVVVLALCLATLCAAQAKPGGVKGKVRVEEGASAEGVAVSVRIGDREVARAATDRNGRFEITGVAPGHYSVVFRKAGLRTAEIKDYEITAGKVRALGDRVYMPVDEGSLALLRGSVFRADGYSLGGAEVQLFRLLPDGTAEKIDGRVTNEMGEFAFRLLPAAARYRVTAKYGRLAPASKEIDVEGPSVYRVGLSLGEPTP